MGGSELVEAGVGGSRHLLSARTALRARKRRMMRPHRLRPHRSRQQLSWRPVKTRAAFQKRLFCAIAMDHGWALQSLGSSCEATTGGEAYKCATEWVTHGSAVYTREKCNAPGLYPVRVKENDRNQQSHLCRSTNRAIPSFLYGQMYGLGRAGCQCGYVCVRDGLPRTLPSRTEWNSWLWSIAKRSTHFLPSRKYFLPPIRTRL